MLRSEAKKKLKERVSFRAFSVHICRAVLGFKLPESRLENM